MFVKENQDGKKLCYHYFLRDLDYEMTQCERNKSNNDIYSIYSEVIKALLDKHTPLKRIDQGKPRVCTTK